MGGETDQVRWRGVRPIAGIDGVWPAINSVWVHASAFKSEAGIVTVYTVPADKKLFIASAFLGSRLSATTQAWSSLRLRDSGHNELYWIYCQYMDIAGQLATSQAFFPALQADAGDYIYMELPGVTPIDARGIIHGWLEDA